MGGIVGSIIGAVKGSKAAGKASGQLVAAGKESLAFQREIFETTEANAAPFIEGGGLGLAALLFELGLGDAPLLGTTTTFTGIKKKGRGEQVFDNRKDAEEFAGKKGSVEETKTPSGEQFAGFQESPGFKFAFQQGVNAVDASAAASGGLFSGSTLEDLTKFGQGFASQERGTFLNRLQSLVSVGQTGVGQVASSGSVFAQGGSQTIEGIGNAKAAGTIGKNNAFQAGLEGVTTSLGSAAGGFFGLSF